MSDAEITPGVVFELICDEGRMNIDEVSRRLTDGKSRCSECGKSTTEYERVREEVRDSMATLMDRGKLASTPNWEYKVPKRFQ